MTCTLTERFNASGQVVPILRAGLVLLEQATTVLPNSQTMHVGYVRNEETLEVSLSGALPASCYRLCCSIQCLTSMAVTAVPLRDPCTGLRWSL